MVLLYTARKSNRLQYIVKFVLGEICGYDYSVTRSTESFINFKGAKINYSDNEFPGDYIRILPHGFLNEKGIRDFQPPFLEREPWPYVFPNLDEGKNCDLGYDIFSAAFYLVSRYEEYLPYLEDRYGRFEADQSFSYQNRFLEKPLVDLQAMDLRKKLTEKFPFEMARERTFKFIPTYDIDVAYAYRGRELSRNILAIGKDILTFNFANLKHRLEVLTNRKPDPYDTYEFQLELQKQLKFRPIYFFLAARYGHRDKNISIYSKHFFHLLKKLGDYADTGIHPSYNSHYKQGRLLEEIKTIAGILNQTVERSRQHYLKIHLPDTYLNLLRYNIFEDYSMGFASHTGFRSGTCTPFYFFNLPEENETKLKVFPVILMDATLRDYMKLNPDQAAVKAKQLTDIVKEVNGTFICLWHNDSLSDIPPWQGWRKMYVNFIEYAIRIQRDGEQKRI